MCNLVAENQPNMNSLCFMRLLRLIWQIPRRHHSTTQYQAHSLSSLCFENLFETINIHKEFCGEKEGLKASVTSLNKTNTCDGYDFNIDIINDDEYNALQKELLMLFDACCIFGFREFFKNLFCILMEVSKTMYENNEDVPKKNWTIYIQNHVCVMLHLRLCGMSLQQMKTRVSIDHQ
jgi:hypothetical protein